MRPARLIGLLGIGGNFPSWQVTPTSLPPGMVYSGASLRTQVNADGSLGYGPHNLLTRSEALTAAEWTKVDVTTPNDWTILESAANNQHFVVNGTPFSVVGYTAVFSVEVKPSGRDWVRLALGDGIDSVFFNVALGVVGTNAGLHSATIAPTTDGYYVCTVRGVVRSPSAAYIFVASANNIYGYAGDTSKGIAVRRMRLMLAGSDGVYYPTTSAAYFGLRTQDYSDNALVPGIKIEPQETNRCPYSEAMNSWTSAGATVAANAASSLFGAATACKIVERSGAGASYLQIATTGSGGPLKLWVKADSRRYVFFESDLANSRTYWDTQTNTYSAVGSGVTAIAARQYANGWWLIGTDGAHAGTLYVGVSNESGSISYTGDGASGAFVWGVSVGVSGSYIPTAASQVTRAADAWAFSSVTGQGATGTFYADVDPGGSSAAQTIVRNTQTPAGGDLRAYLSNATTLIVEKVGTGTLTTHTVTAGARLKIAVSYSGAGVRSCVNGGTVQISATTVNSTAGVTLGNDGSGGSVFNGSFYSANHYPQALPASTLQALTA